MRQFVEVAGRAEHLTLRDVPADLAATRAERVRVEAAPADVLAKLGTPPAPPVSKGRRMRWSEPGKLVHLQG